MKYLKNLKSFELYSTHRYHTEKLDDLLDIIMPILDDYNIREWREEYIYSTHPNFRFSYKKNNTHMEDQHDNIIITGLLFDDGQKVIKEIESIQPRIEKILNTQIKVKTSDSISTPELIKAYLKSYLDMGEEQYHPYIQVNIIED